MYRLRGGQLEVLLGHPGGPFFQSVDAGVWSLPKGLVESGEDPQATAYREFQEETGITVGDRPLLALGDVRQKGGKRVVAWAFEGDCDPAALRSNTFEIEWPRGSGRVATFPEMDRFGFFGTDAIAEKMNSAQVAFVDRLKELLA